MSDLSQVATMKYALIVRDDNRYAWATGTLADVGRAYSKLRAQSVILMHDEEGQLRWHLKSLEGLEMVHGAPIPDAKDESLNLQRAFAEIAPFAAMKDDAVTLLPLTDEEAIRCYEMPLQELLAELKPEDLRDLPETIDEGLEGSLREALYYRRDPAVHFGTVIEDSKR